MDAPKAVTASFKAITSLSYTGAQLIDLGTTVTPAAKLSGSAACVAGQPIDFELDDNPTTAAPGDGPFTVAPAATDATGLAQASASTSGWHEGAYTVTAAFAGSSSCAASSADATLAVVGAGSAADGGGWYSLTDAPRVNFAFIIRPVAGVKPAHYTGSLLLLDGRWRLSGTISDYSNASGGNKAASGSGDLAYWDASTKKWVSTTGPSSFTISFRDGAQGSGKKADLFGIQIDHLVWSPPEPSTLPNSAPQQIKAGDIRVN
jgi:hypothetical protein